MEAVHPLRLMLERAARGRFPPPDGTVRVVSSPPGRSDAVMAFTAHHVIAADLPADEVLAHVPPGDLGAPMNARFLAWLGERLGTAPGSLDVVLSAPGLAGETDASVLRRAPSIEHDRVARAERYREDLLVYTDPDEAAVVIVGRGLALRPEVSLEVRADARHRGLGRKLILAARVLFPAEEILFAQVAPGNAASLRAFLAAGFTPIGAEVLFLRSGRGE